MRALTKNSTHHSHFMDLQWQQHMQHTCSGQLRNSQPMPEEFGWCVSLEMLATCKQGLKSGIGIPLAVKVQHAVHHSKGLSSSIPGAHSHISADGRHSKDAIHDGCSRPFSGGNVGPCGLGVSA
jgi:hypothetical protein